MPGPAFTGTTLHGPLALCDLLTLDIPSFSDTPPRGWGWGKIAPGWDFPQVPMVQNRLEQRLSAQVQAHTVGAQGCSRRRDQRSKRWEHRHLPLDERRKQD